MTNKRDWLRNAKSNANECDLLGAILNLMAASEGHSVRIGSDLANQAYDIARIFKKRCGCR